MREKTYKVVVADPPWPFDDKLPGPKRGAESHYRVLKVPDIARFLATDVREKISERSAILFLWCVPAMAREALQVCEGWGFAPKSEIVWVKVGKGVTHPAVVGGAGLAFGMGRYVRMTHERCIIAARGKALHLIQDHAVRSVFFAEVGRHSEKPEVFFDLVEKLVPGGPYLELFARRRRPGWTCLGNELPAASEKSA